MGGARPRRLSAEDFDGREEEKDVVKEALTVKKSLVSRMPRSQSRLTSWSLVHPTAGRLVLVVSEDAPHKVRSIALEHCKATTREYSLWRVAKSHGDPEDTRLLSRARLLPKICSCSRGQNNTNSYALSTCSRRCPLSLCLSHSHCSKGFPRALGTCNRTIELYMCMIWATGESCPTDEKLSVISHRKYRKAT